MENEIIEMKQSFEVAKILFPTEEYVQAVEDEFRDFPTDMTVPENYALVKSGVKKVKRYLTATEKYRKSSQAKELLHCQNTNKAANILSSRFSAVNDPMVKVVKDYEIKIEIQKREAERIEKERQEAIETRINNITGLVSTLIQSDANEVKKQIDTLTNNDVTAWADEYKIKAIELKSSVMVQLVELYNMKIQVETAKEATEKAEEERLEKEKEEQKKRDAEQKAIRIENAKLKAEQEKDAAKLRAANKIIADQKEAAELAEQKRKIAEKEARDAAEKERLRIVQEKKREEKKAADAIETEKLRIKKEKEEREKAEVDAKLKAEKAEADEIAKKEAVDLTTKQIITQMTGCLGNAGSPGEEEEAFVFFLIKAIQEDKFNHIKWVN